MDKAFIKNPVEAYEKLKEENKKLKAENEELKEEIKTNSFGCFNIEMSKELDQLKKENEKLKEDLNQKYVRNDIKEYCPFFFRDTATCLGRDLNEIGQLKFCRKYHNCWIKKIAKENIQLKLECGVWKNLTVDNGAVALKYQEQLNQLKQALEEIKEATEQAKKHEFVNMTDYWNYILAKCEVVDED